MEMLEGVLWVSLEKAFLLYTVTSANVPGRSMFPVAGVSCGGHSALGSCSTPLFSPMSQFGACFLLQACLVVDILHWGLLWPLLKKTPDPKILAHHTAVTFSWISYNTVSPDFNSSLSVHSAQHQRPKKPPPPL